MAVKLKDNVKALWLEALRSGEYEQGQGHLTYVSGETRQRYDCCLGVLCEIARIDGLELEIDDIPDLDGVTIRRYDRQEGMVPVAVWNWAVTPENAITAAPMGQDFNVDVPNPNHDQYDDEPETVWSQLSEENDNGKNFAYIAALIENQL